MNRSGKRPLHDHSLTLSSGFALRCYWCKKGGYINDGYHCNKCDVWFHKECGKFLTKINHPSKHEHPLHIAVLRNWLSYQCRECRKRIDGDWAYRCSVCKKNYLHLSCSKEPPPLAIEHPKIHEHPLMFFPISRDASQLCEVCKSKVDSQLACRCFECKVVIHVEFANSHDVNHPCHSKHPLKLFTTGAPDYTDNMCLLWGLKLEDFLHHCSICNFSICLSCANIPPPGDLVHPKIHEHKLTFMARQISFTCNACGMQGDRSLFLPSM